MMNVIRIVFNIVAYVMVWAAGVTMLVFGDVVIKVLMLFYDTLYPVTVWSKSWFEVVLYMGMAFAVGVYWSKLLRIYRSKIMIK